MMKRNGFTLIELMVSVAIMSILVAISMPQYTKYITRSNRIAMQADLMQIASALERMKAVQLTYTGADLTSATIYGSSTYPKGSTGTQVLYNLVLGPANASTAPTTVAALSTNWEVSAIPANKQAGDGLMKLNSLGQSCWNKGTDSTCDITLSTQSWRNR